MCISLNGLKEILASVPISVSERLPDPVPQQELVESFPVEVFCGKMLIQLNQKILWESAYSFKTSSESKAIELSIHPVSQPSSLVAVSIGSSRLSVLCLTYQVPHFLAVVQTGKLSGFLGKPAACLISLQNCWSCIVHT